MIDVVLIHGAGQSPATWCCLIPLLDSCRVISVTLPGHGDAGEMSMDRFIDSVKASIRDMRNTVIIGHSLGGSIATHFPDALSVVMIDICETTAINSLDTLPLLLQRQPKSFENINDAVLWYKRHNPQCRIPEKAIMGQLVEQPDGTLKWRVDLLQSQPLWRSWFEGMDARFLACRNPLLIMSTREWMDKELMVASMQGKFQLQVIPDAGHFLQEDQPELLALVINKHIERLCRLASVTVYTKHDH